MKQGIPSIALYLMLVVLILGCSDGGSPVSSPVSEIPGETPGINAPENSRMTSADNHFLWMYYLVRIDPDSPDSVQVEMIPFRDVAAHWNVLSFLEQWPCRNCLKIVDMVYGGNDVLIAEVRITHPFINANLTGFDVRGITMFDGSRAYPISGLNTPDRESGDGELVNADGYTTLYNPGTIGSGPGGYQGYTQGRFASDGFPGALLNGYIRHISDDPANTRNAFYAGDSVTKIYQIDMPNGPFVFGYAVDACWSQAINRPVEDPMTDFGPDANCEEPWKVAVQESTVDDGLTTCGGLTFLNIDVYDWQGRESHYLPVIECPEILTDVRTAEWIADGDGFASYQLSIMNEELATEGEYECLVSVEDNENDPVGKPWLDLTAYQLITLEVSEYSNLSPVAVVEASATSAFVGELITFDGSGSYDGDCNGKEIVQWEWDWENDGTYDDECAVVDHSWDTPGLYEVRLKVTDDEGSMDKSESLPIEISQKAGWVTVWTEGANWADEIASDAEGNIYVAGLSSVDSDIYASLRKVSPDGVELWSKSWGGSIALSDGVAVDDAANAVYVTGYFASSCDFDPGPGEKIFTQIEKGDAYVSSFDQDGNFRWASAWGGNEIDKGRAVGFDSEGNAYIGGEYGAAVDFDPGEEIDRRPSDGSLDMFVCKYDGLGNYLWTMTWEGQNACSDIVIDHYDLLHIAGSFSDIIDFDLGPGVEERNPDIAGHLFMGCYDTDGNFQWVWTWGATDPFKIGGHRVALDGSGNHLIIGAFTESIDFDPGPGEEIRESLGENDGYLCKFDPSGNLIWVATWGSTYYDFPRDVAVDGPGNVYGAGGFHETVDFDPGPDIENRTSLGKRDAFLLKILADGTW